MDNVFDRIVIAVPDLAVAIAQYEVLLGAVSFPCTVRGLPAAWLGLPNTVVELVQDNVPQPVIRGLVFCSAAQDRAARPLANSLLLDIRVCNGQDTANFRRQQSQAQSDGLLVDHLVLRTADADACIALFAHELGIRLALDKTVAAWGGRMLFFRAGKLTLEVIESDKEPEGGNFFWGIAYQCQNLLQKQRELAERAVVLSEIREGRKPGTRVATIKDHCLGIPTLLLEPARP